MRRWWGGRGGGFQSERSARHRRRARAIVARWGDAVPVQARRRPKPPTAAVSIVSPAELSSCGAGQSGPVRTGSATLAGVTSRCEVLRWSMRPADECHAPSEPPSYPDIRAAPRGSDEHRGAALATRLTQVPPHHLPHLPHHRLGRPGAGGGQPRRGPLRPAAGPEPLGKPYAADEPSRRPPSQLTRNGAGWSPEGTNSGLGAEHARGPPYGAATVGRRPPAHPLEPAVTARDLCRVKWLAHACGASGRPAKAPRASLFEPRAAQLPKIASDRPRHAPSAATGRATRRLPLWRAPHGRGRRSRRPGRLPASARRQPAGYPTRTASVASRAMQERGPMRISGELPRQSHGGARLHTRSRACRRLLTHALPPRESRVKNPTDRRGT